MKLLIHIILSVLLTNMTAYVANAQDIGSSPAQNSSAEVRLKDKNVLRGGWYLWKPYQFNKVTTDKTELVGLDVEITMALAKEVGLQVDYSEVSWKQHQLDLKNGDRDIAAGATYTDARAEYVYFSAPYRFKSYSLFTLKHAKNKIDFYDVKELLDQVKLHGYKLGIIDGFVYAEPRINDFITDKANSKFVVRLGSDSENLHALTQGKIDGFISDGVSCGVMVADSNLSESVKEVSLNIKTPVHLMFSKKTVSLDTVRKFNKAIDKFMNSKKYKEIVKKYVKHKK